MLGAPSCPHSHHPQHSARKARPGRRLSAVPSSASVIPARLGGAAGRQLPDRGLGAAPALHRVQGAGDGSHPSLGARLMAARPTDRTTFQREAERRFPYRVDIPVASGGFGRQTELHDGWRSHVAAGQWAQHGCVARRDDRGVPLDFTRWYFMAAADAEAFRRQWGGNDV